MWEGGVVARLASWRELSRNDGAENYELRSTGLNNNGKSLWFLGNSTPMMWRDHPSQRLGPKEIAICDLPRTTALGNSNIPSNTIISTSRADIRYLLSLLPGLPAKGTARDPAQPYLYNLFPSPTARVERHKKRAQDGEIDFPKGGVGR